MHDHVRATLSPIRTPASGVSPRVSGDWPRPSLDTSRRNSADLIRRSGDWTRKSMDLSRDKMFLGRKSFDGRRSASTSRVRLHERTANSGNESASPKHAESSDSYVHSMEPSAASSSAFNGSSNASASQILSRSDVFQSPTIKRHAELAGGKTDQAGSKAEPARGDDSPMGGKVQIHSPSTPGSRISPKDPRGAFSNIEPRKDSTSSLQDLVKGSFPVQKAAGFAGYLRRGSKKMSDLLASESMGYVEKVSGMWQGGHKH